MGTAVSYRLRRHELPPDEDYLSGDHSLPRCAGRHNDFLAGGLDRDQPLNLGHLAMDEHHVGNVNLFAVSAGSFDAQIAAPQSKYLVPEEIDEMLLEDQTARVIAALAAADDALKGHLAWT